MRNANRREIYVLATLCIIFSSVLSCKVRRNGAESVALGSRDLKWNEKVAIYDFGRICGAAELDWAAQRSSGVKPGAYLEKVLEDATPIQEPILGKSSGVVVDTAVRLFNSKIFETCGHGQAGIELRYTIDVLTDGQKAFEVFVKDLGNKQVIGLAFNADGKELNEVPDKLAFDKVDSKDPVLAKNVGDKNYVGDKIVRSRLGCFSCHPSVSSAVNGDQKFWGDAKLVEFLDREKTGAANGQNNATAPNGKVTCNPNFQTLSGQSYCQKYHLGGVNPVSRNRFLSNGTYERFASDGHGTNTRLIIGGCYEYRNGAIFLEADPGSPNNHLYEWDKISDLVRCQ